MLLLSLYNVAHPQPVSLARQIGLAGENAASFSIVSTLQAMFNGLMDWL